MIRSMAIVETEHAELARRVEYSRLMEQARPPQIDKRLVEDLWLEVRRLRNERAQVALEYDRQQISATMEFLFGNHAP